MRDRDDAIRDSERRFTRRSLILASAEAAGFALIGWRLFDLQVLERGHYAPLAEENRINLQILAPRRGRILDDTGRPLADNERSFAPPSRRHWSKTFPPFLPAYSRFCR